MGFGAGSSENESQHYGLRQDFCLPLQENVVTTDFVHCQAWFPFPLLNGHWTLLWGPSSYGLFDQTTFSHHRNGQHDPVLARGPCSSIWFRYEAMIRARTISLLQDFFFSRVVRKRALFLPVGITSWKGNVSLELWCSSLTQHGKSLSENKASSEGNRAEKSRWSARNMMITFQTVDSARPEGNTVHFPVIWAN